VTGRRALVALGIVVAVVAVGAIVASAFGQPPRQTETGVVTAVDAASLTDVRGFTIRTPDGRTVTFRMGQLENGAQFPPGHLGEHMATAVPVVVTYRDEGGNRVAVRLEDAVASPALQRPLDLLIPARESQGPQLAEQDHSIPADLRAAPRQEPPDRLQDVAGRGRTWRTRGAPPGSNHRRHTRSRDS
jgi:hypothetical protein